VIRQQILPCADRKYERKQRGRGRDREAAAQRTALGDPPEACAHPQGEHCVRRQRVDVESMLAHRTVVETKQQKQYHRGHEERHGQKSAHPVPPDAPLQGKPCRGEQRSDDCELHE
jgi:hypothetical protein